MWLHNPKTDMLTLVPTWMPDTIKRCLEDGWVEVPDPRPVMPSPGTDADAQPLVGSADAEPEAEAAAPIPAQRRAGQKGRR